VRRPCHGLGACDHCTHSHAPKESQNVIPSVLHNGRRGRGFESANPLKKKKKTVQRRKENRKERKIGTKYYYCHEQRTRVLAVILLTIVHNGNNNSYDI